jgi:hypothetical protein
MSVFVSRRRVRRAAPASALAEPGGAEHVEKLSLAARAFFAWVAFSALLVASSTLTVARSFDPDMVWLGLLFTSPMLLLISRGHLGWRSVDYPTIGLAAFVTWQMGLGPSMVAQPRSAMPFFYSDEAMTIGNVVYACWGWLYAAASGEAPRSRGASAPAPPEPLAPYVGIFVVWTFVTAWSALGGHLSNYDASGSELRAGGVDTAFAFFYIVLTPLMPSIAVLLARQAHSRGPRVLALAAGGASLLVLFLAGGRIQFVWAFLTTVVLLRARRAPFRPALVLGGAAATALVSVALIAYRSALLDAGRRTHGLSGQVEAAASAVTETADAGDREAVTEDASENVRQHLAYAPQYFVAVDYVLGNGPTLAPTMLRGLVQAIPTFIEPNKNQWVDEIDLESTMVRSGRWPDIDLSPSPLLEWVFVFGVFFAPLGGALFGALGRWVDRAMAAPRMLTLARYLLLGSAAKVLLAFEGDTSALTINMREPAALAALAALLGYFGRYAGGEPARRPGAAQLSPQRRPGLSASIM